MVKTTLNNVLLQEDSMYLEALNSGLIVLDSGVDLLSINNLPSVVYVTCYADITDNFSYELCQSVPNFFESKKVCPFVLRCVHFLILNSQ